MLTLGGATLVEGVDYALAYNNNIEPGQASVTITGAGAYTGTIERAFTIAAEPDDSGQKPQAKATQTITAKSVTVKVALKKLKKKQQKVNAAKAGKVSAKTTVTYTGKANKKASNFKVSKKGVITVKKGTPKGKYKVKITANAAANATYEATGPKTFTITVKVS